MQPLTWPLPSYALRGPQVDPFGALELTDSRLKMPTIQEIRRHCDPILERHPFPQTPEALQADLDELVDLEARRNNREISGGSAGRERCPLSVFLQARSTPSSPVGDQHTVGGPCIQTGADLARWFENDTPLLGGWMALNVLLANSKPGKPPTEQAFIWAALNASISTALLAAWHYKWIEPSSRLKPRPTEVFSGLSVLYAKNSDGTDRPNTNGFSGVPRHPSYPSGHSTVGGATAAILKRFFEDSKDQIELDNLADNAGLGRMWAGIHYRADHEFGVALGEAVVDLVYPKANP